MRFVILFLSLILAVNGKFIIRGRLKEVDYDHIKTAVQQLIMDNEDENGVKFLIPGFVRLAFHDCVGGCDGCVNFDQPANRGLREIADKLETVYNNENLDTKDVLSRADLWALAAITATEISVDRNNNIFCPKNTQIKSCTCPRPKMRFLAGRKDCDSSPSTAEVNDMPSEKMTFNEFKNWWKDNFGCSPNQGVALMGFHSLGKSNAHNLKGVWEAGNQDGLNTKFFQNIEDKCVEWKQVVVGEGDAAVAHWTGRKNAFALNADMAMFKNFETVGKNGSATCEYNDCPRSPGTAGMLSRYANDCDNWMKHINWLFPVKVLENGYHLHWMEKKKN